MFEYEQKITTSGFSLSGQLLYLYDDFFGVESYDGSLDTNMINGIRVFLS